MEKTLLPEVTRSEKLVYVSPELVELGDVTNLTHTISVIVE